MRETEPPRRMELEDYEEFASGPKPKLDLPTPHVPAINWPQMWAFLIGLAIVFTFAWWRRHGF
jgi:hypothetical protein